MKTFYRTLFIVMSIAFLIGSFVLLLTTESATAVALSHSLPSQDNVSVYNTNAITHTNFLPFIRKPYSEDGELLFVSDQDVPEKYEIYKMGLDDGTAVRLTNLSIESIFGAEHTFSPRWSPDGTKFVSQMDGNLYIFSQDGSLLDTLFEHPAIVADGIPTWSPDGQNIAFITRKCLSPTCAVFTGGGLRVIDVQTKAIMQVIPDGTILHSEMGIEWLPDGQSLMAVIVNYGSGNDGIAIGYLNGTPTQWILTQFVIQDFSLSPNAQKIAFSTSSRNASSHDRAYTADIDGNNIQTVFDGVSETVRVYGITWHPSSNRVAYVVSRSDGLDRTIYVSNPDGSNAKDMLPSTHSLNLKLWGWTSDGSNILFISDRNRATKRYDIYKIHDDGSNLTNLTPNSPRDDVLADYTP